MDIATAERGRAGVREADQPVRGARLPAADRARGLALADDPAARRRGLGVSIAPACVRHVANADVACVPLEETRVLSELALLCRTSERRPMVHGFARVARAT
jgi:hypothetical protein